MTEQTQDERPPLALSEVARVALELAGERELQALLARFLEAAQMWASPSAIVAAVRDTEAETGWRVLPKLSCGSVPLGIERSLASLVARSPECLGGPTVLRPTEEVPGVKPRDNWVLPWSCEEASGLLLLRGVPRPWPPNLGEALALAAAPVWPRLLGSPAARVEGLVREIGEASRRLQAEAERQLERLQALHAADAERERVEALGREQAELAERVSHLSADLESAEKERLAAGERLLEEKQAAEAAAAEVASLCAEVASLKGALAAAEARASAAEQTAAQATSAAAEGEKIGAALAAEHARERERAELASARAEAAEARLHRSEAALASAQAGAGTAQEASLAAEQRAVAAEEKAEAAGQRAAAAESRAAAAEQAARVAEERALAAEKRAAAAEEAAAPAGLTPSDAGLPAEERAELSARLAERERAVEAAEARARAAEEALVHAQHQRLQALTSAQRQSEDAGPDTLRAAGEARAAAEARARDAEQALTEARRDFAELRSRNDQAEAAARDASARIDAALAGVHEVIASAHRAAFVPPGLRLHLEEVATRLRPQPRGEAAWLKIAILDRDLGGLEPLAASLEALGLDVRVANYPEEVGLLLKTPAAREIGAAVCDVMAFRPDQNVAGLFRSWEKDRPGLPLFLSFDPESPVELERAKRIPTSLLAGQVSRPIASARLVEILQLLARRQAAKA